MAVNENQLLQLKAKISREIIKNFFKERCLLPLRSYKTPLKVFMARLRFTNIHM